MQQRLENYDTGYGNFSDEVKAAIRRETYGEDIGQFSWLTADEYRTFFTWLALDADHHVLDVACGAGGPTLFLTRTVGCRVTGIDLNEQGIATARHAAVEAGLNSRVHFQAADMQEALPFLPGTFDALVCIDAILHFPDRLQVLKDWFRVLQPGARLLYTDGGVLTGPISSEEIATAARSLDFLVFVPVGANETLLEQAGFRLLRCEDVTENVACVSERWHASRQRHYDQLVQLIGQERFDISQSSLALRHRLTRERRLSRMVYVAEKPMA